MSYYEERKKIELFNTDIENHNKEIVGKMVKIENNYWKDVFNTIKVHDSKNPYDGGLQLNFKLHDLEKEKDKKINDLREKYQKFIR